jgi:2-polyprenyl-3-methyl-5-hydroxy-6-metoxy-1,4-benzoquinol methylase
MGDKSNTKEYYDDFSRRVLVQDFRYLNLRHEAIKSLYRRYVPRGARVLDIGCGVGILARYLQQIASFVLAVDISEENVRIAREYAASDRCEVRVLDVITQAGELQSLGTFDMAVMPDVIEHIPKEDYARLFQSIESVLSPGGRIILTFPSPEMQTYLEREKPEALQLHEEKIELADILAATTLKPIYFHYKSIFSPNDYVHLVLTTQRDFSPHPSKVSPLRWMVRRWKKYRWRLSNMGFLRGVNKKS